MNHFCIGYAGAYPFGQSSTHTFQWLLMEHHISLLLRASSSCSFAFLEQDMLPPCLLHCDEHFSLRVSLCGFIWNGETCYGNSLESLAHLQALLDTLGPASLNRFEGDFAVSYVLPDYTQIWFYRSISSTRGLYYRLTEASIIWSTNPTDLFVQGQPTLDDVDEEMVAITAATGLADRWRTCYRGLSCLPPGEGICLQDGCIVRTLHTDYTHQEELAHLSYTQAAKRLREHIEAAVFRTLHGFPSFNVFISGGLDTAVIAYEAARLGKELHGFHWTWDLPIFRDEDTHARLVADRLGIVLHPLNFSASLAVDSEYLFSMQGLILPYNHPFYSCFRQTIAAVAALGTGNVQVLAGGHLGDTLFQGDWVDAFRPVQSSPMALLRLFRDLLSWYPRMEAFTIFCYLLGRQHDLEDNPSVQRIESNRPLFTERAFQQVLMHGRVDYRDLQSNVWKQQSLSARKVQASLQSNIDFNTDLETAIIYQDAFAHQVVLRHPFGDRRLHEFCLSLGPHHRNRWCAGQNYNKFLLRLAYLDDLPQGVINREIRTPYAAISEQFCLRNREMLKSVFNQQSLLTRLRILDQKQVQEILATSELCQKHSRSLFRIAGVEMWLRGLIKEPQLVQTQDHTPYNATSKNAKNNHCNGAITLNPLVKARTINGNCVLIHTQTLLVSRFDDTGMLFWEAFLQEENWSDVIVRIHHSQPKLSLAEIQELVYNFAWSLACAGWITLKEQDEIERYIHAFPTNIC